ncbi:carboxypeptidase-like regulatory domain-containing protein [Gimesia algae]|uniref:Nickel uptake substrate-specific transmembrane region n=1 Tax=Gimesia algae TaxID=2527971 RepID=A0A517V602_9PLAN|nr:carboxypeptidase-like regulatory domain-containing protein [Gimesia algae]QDT88438.1 Nickel uptake substrate-specific transmembrane region [Gimesia algae]
MTIFDTTSSRPASQPISDVPRHGNSVRSFRILIGLIILLSLIVGIHPLNLASAQDKKNTKAPADKYWTVGGIIVDKAGQPVADANISVDVRRYRRNKDVKRPAVNTKITTNTTGQWQFDYVPDSESEVFIAINHPEYGPWRKRINRSVFEVKANARPSAKITLGQGLNITGSVTDENGKPVGGALIRTKFLNEIRETKTDEFGVYLLSGCEPRVTRIVASAKGRALEVKEVRVAPEMEPVDFVLKPGGKIRIRVVDENGKGIPKARIFFQRWRGRIDYFEFDHVSQYADEHGIWEWDEAPLDEFQADICRPGGMQLSQEPLIAREKEYVFTPPPALVVSGRVIDAKTKQPIKQFHVTPGLRNSDPRLGMNWIPRDSFDATDGTYRVRLKHDYPAHLVRIEATGYQLAVSRDIKTDEGEIEIDFALKPAQDIAATLMTAAGKPAAGAKIALGVADSQINVENGEIDDGSTIATQLKSDAKGHFSIPARTEPFQLMITHPAGYAHLKSEKGAIPETVTLTPWARIEGTFRVGTKPVAGVPLTIFSNVSPSYGEGVPNIFTHHDTTTGKDGRYVFERVFPGHGRINRRIKLTVNAGSSEPTSSVRVPVDFVAGETISLDLGGTGRPVIGKLAAPVNHQGEVLWAFALVDAHRYLTPPAGMLSLEAARKDPLHFRDWVLAWRKSPAYEVEKVVYQKYQQARSQLLAESPSLTASIARDGTFRIDDVPPGDYVLKVTFRDQKHAVGSLTDVHFTVPPVENGFSSEALDLGTLTMQK